jgi:hypothetical protein
MQFKGLLRSPFEPGILTLEAFSLSLGIITGSVLLGYLAFFYITTTFAKRPAPSSSALSSAKTEKERDRDHCGRMSRLILEMRAVIEDAAHIKTIYMHGYGPKEHMIWSLHHIGDLLPDGNWPEWIRRHDEEYIKIITHYDGLLVPDGRLILQADVINEAEDKMNGYESLEKGPFYPMDRRYKKGGNSKKSEESEEGEKGEEVEKVEKNGKGEEVEKVEKNGKGEEGEKGEEGKESEVGDEAFIQIPGCSIR